MSDSYPTIQDELSTVQKDFMGCVETHLDPPEHHGPSYAVDALFRCEAGPTRIRFALAVDQEDEDVTERLHTIEFTTAGSSRADGWVRHRMKRVEAGRGRFFWTESRFEVAGPGVASGTAAREDVEDEVRTFVDRIRVLDRERKLVEVPQH